MAVDDVFRLQVISRRITDGPMAVNNLYFRQASVLILDTPEEDLIQAFMDECETLYSNLFTNTMALTEYKVAQSPLFLTSYVANLAGPGGTITGDPLPARIAGVISYKTADLTKRGRGRIYLPPAGEASNTAGAPSTSYIAALQALADALLNDMNTITIGHCKWEQNMWSPSDQAAKAVTQSFGRGRWGSQRDRSEIY